MKLLPDNPTQFDYLHAIRAVAARGDMSAVPKLKEIFNLADAGMQLPSDTPEQRATAQPAPTPAMLGTEPVYGKRTVLDIVWEILVDNGLICHREPVNPNTTFQELEMDSLDIARLVVEVDPRFGIELDNETAWPTTVRELVAQIENQLTRP